MSAKNTGGPAFPKPDVRFDGEMIYTPSGMTLRDWFAGMTEVPWGAVIDGLRKIGNDAPTVGEVCKYRAQIKYIAADALLTEREKDL